MTRYTLQYSCMMVIYGNSESALFSYKTSMAYTVEEYRAISFFGFTNHHEIVIYIQINIYLII